LSESLRYGDSVLCDAEKLTADSSYFITGKKNIYCGNGILRTEEQAHTGKYGLRLSPENPYGMTCIIRQVKGGDAFILTAWTYGTDDGFITASGPTSEIFYKSDKQLLHTDKNGWKQIQLKFTLPEKLNFNSLKIYLYNGGKSILYFDDFIIRKQIF
jgi:hypothetical protein